jgi:hypothetical protein
VSAFKKTFGIEHTKPVHFNPPSVKPGCFCLLGGNSTMNVSENYLTSMTSLLNADVSPTTLPQTISSVTSLLSNVTQSPNVSTTEKYKPSSALEAECLTLGGYMQGVCDEKYVPDVFFFSLILFFGTFFLATVLVHFRHSLFFPTFVSISHSSYS